MIDKMTRRSALVAGLVLCPAVMASPVVARQLEGRRRGVALVNNGQPADRPGWIGGSVDRLEWQPGHLAGFTVVGRD